MTDIILKWLGNPSEAGALTESEKSQLGELTTVVPDGAPVIAKNWGKAVNDTTFYFGIWSSVHGPVGLIGWCGDAPVAEPSWWVHPQFQGRRCASAAVDLLAGAMFAAGVTGISKKVSIEVVYDFRAGQTEQDLEGIAARSRALLARLKKKFADLLTSRASSPA